MAWTQQDLDALRAAAAKGIHEVSYGDKKVTYATLDEIRRLISEIEAQIDAPTRRGKRKVIMVSSKGTQ